MRSETWAHLRTRRESPVFVTFPIGTATLSSRRSCRHIPAERHRTSQSATPATQNDMSTSSDTSRKTRFGGFPHRHANLSPPTVVRKWLRTLKAGSREHVSTPRPPKCKRRTLCVAGVALCDIRCLSAGMCLHDRREGKVAVSGRRGTLWHSMSFRRNVSAGPSWQKSCRAHGENHKNVSFSTYKRVFFRCQKMWSCRFAWQAWHFVTFDVFQPECVCTTVVRIKLPCLWEKSQKRVFLDVSEDVLMSFCVAGMALCDIWLHTPHSTLSTLHTLHSYSTLHTPHSTLYTLHFTLHTLHFALHIPHSTLHTLHSTLYPTHSTFYKPHSTLSTPHFTLHTLHSHSTLNTPHSSHFTLHTLHSRLYTPHSTLYTSHFTNHTPHSPLHTWHSTLYTPHFTLHTPHSTLYTPHFTLHTLHFTLHTLHSTLYTPHFPLHTLHSALYTSHFTLLLTLHTLHFHFTLHTPHFTNHTPHSPLQTLHSTLSTPHSTLYTPHSPISTPHFTLHTPHSTLYTPHSTSTFDSPSTYIGLLDVICIRVRWLLLFFFPFILRGLPVHICPCITNSIRQNQTSPWTQCLLNSI